MHHKIALKDVYKGYTLDQDKVLPPEETVKRVKQRLKSVDLDILEKTVRMDNGRLDIPVYLSVCGRDAADIIGAQKQMGKGGTPQQAEASAIMELAERFSFFSFYKNDQNFFVETYQDIKEHALAFDMIAQSVHDYTPDLDKAGDIFRALPLKWTWAYNLTREEEVLVPFNWFYMVNEFNGPSAGNCLEEAVGQGVCEVVERHVSSLVSRQRIKVPAIDLDSVANPFVAHMIQKYQKAGIAIYAHDLSLDTGIPTIGVLAYDPHTFPEKSEIVWTAGTAAHPEKALSRALTEVAQLAGDFNTDSKYMASGLPKFKNLDQAEFLTKPEKTIPISRLADISEDNIRVEVKNCVAALSKIGLEVILVNITHPLLGIPACYTIIPGAHFRERTAGTSVGMFSAKLVSETNDPKSAQAILNKMDQQLPGKYYIQFYLGLTGVYLNQPAKALEHFNAALSRTPNIEDLPIIYSYMGVALKALERYGEAIEVLKKGKAYDQDRTDIHNLLGFCYFKRKEHEKAIQCFQEVIRINPHSAIDYANIASNYRDMRKTEKAVAYYRLALKLDPSIDFARQNLLRLAPRHSDIGKEKTESGQ